MMRGVDSLGVYGSGLNLELDDVVGNHIGFRIIKDMAVLEGKRS